MFQRVLVGYDGSEAAKKALMAAAELARAGSAELHLVAVGRVPEYEESQAEVDEARERADVYYVKKVEEAVALLEAQGLSATTKVRHGKPSEQILRAADEIHADLIVLGAHAHTAVRRRILGGTANKVVDHAECDVLVVR